MSENVPAEVEEKPAPVWYLYGADDSIVRSSHMEKPAEIPEGLELLEVPGGPIDGDPARQWWRVSNGMLVEMRGKALVKAQAGPLADQLPDALVARARRMLAREEARQAPPMEPVPAGPEDGGGA